MVGEGLVLIIVEWYVRPPQSRTRLQMLIGLARERRGRQRPKIQKQKGRHMHDLLVIARIFSFDLCALVSSFFSLLTKLRSS